MIIVILITLVVLIILTMVIVNFMYTMTMDATKDKSKIFKSKKNRLVIPEPTDYEKELMKEFKNVYITSNDNLKLHAYELRNDNSNDWIILVHGYFSKAEGTIRFASKLHDKFNILLVDLRGHGKSQGTYIGFGVKDRFDIISWIDYLNTKYNEPNIGLYGISMGAATVMMTLGEKLPSNVKFAVEDSGYTSVPDELKYQMHALYHAPAFPFLNLFIMKVKRKHEFSLKETSPLSAVETNKIPTLFIQGDNDTFVPSYMVNKLYKANKGKKEKLIVSGAGHTASCLIAPIKYWETVNNFIKKNNI